MIGDSELFLRVFLNHAPCDITAFFPFWHKQHSLKSLLNIVEAPFKDLHVQYRSKETPQLIGQFSQNLEITNFMQCFLYGPIG